MPIELAVQDIFGEHPYATLVAEIRDFAIFLLDGEGRVVSWNQGARLIFGYEKEEIVGQSGECLFVPEDRQSAVPEQEFRTAMSQGHAEDVRWHLKKDGSRFWANGVTTAITSEAGELLGFAKVARDETQRRQNEAEREELVVVDDQEDTRVMVSVVLQRYGARVTTAASALEALTALQEQRPDVLLSDIGMPDEDGFSLIKRVRALPAERGGYTPAVALTAFARLEDRVKVLRSGFQSHLPKPVEPAELASVVATLAGRYDQE